jgi:hypothetical protein
LGDIVSVTTSVPIAYGLGIVNSRVTAVNSLQIEYLNTTALTLTPATNTIYELVVTRPENLVNNVSNLTQIT